MVLKKKKNNLSNIIQYSTTTFLTGRHIHKITLLQIEYLNLDFIITQNGILEPPEIKSDTVSTASPSISHEVMGPDAMILVF